MTTSPIRNFNRRDLSAVEQLHEKQGDDYLFPDLESPLFVVKKVLELEGTVEMMMGIRLQGEAYLWQDPASDTLDLVERMAAIELLHDEVCAERRRQGLDQIVFWQKTRLRIQLLFGSMARGRVRVTFRGAGIAQPVYRDPDL